jgi:O-antigen/teichoic acid export membrane protein
VTSTVGTLTSGRLLARNVGLNLIGWGLPAVSALVAIPFLVRGLGDARFGLLALAWTTIGYFSLFDLGIGRALTHFVADSLGQEQRDRVGSAVWSAVTILIPVGVLGTAALIAVAPWLVGTLLRVPESLQGEALVGFRLLALAIPFTATAAAFRGLLEASQRFGTINALRVPYGLLTFLGPVAALPFTRSVVAPIAVLAVGRMLLCLAYVVVCARSFPELSGGGSRRFAGAQVKSLVTYGGWMTVSNVISPLMNTFDRFVIGAVASVTLVSYYAAPHELVTKMWLYTAALHPVFFSAFALAGTRDPARNAALFDRALRLTFAGLVGPAFLIALFAREILGVWLGPAYALHSTVPLQILAIAVFINSVGQGAFTLVQGLGRPDLTGKFHLAELPLYAALLWLLIPRYGIVGVAIAWALRATIDALLLLFSCPLLLPGSRSAVQRIVFWLAIAVPAMAMVTMVPTPAARVATALLCVPALGALVWWGVLTESERRAPAQLLTAASPKA